MNYLDSFPSSLLSQAEEHLLLLEILGNEVLLVFSWEGFVLYPLSKCLPWGSLFACHMWSLVPCPVVDLGVTFVIPEAAGPLELAVTSVASFGLLGTSNVP